MKSKHPFLKSVKLIQKGTPALFPMVILSSLIDAAYPFINIILYAKLITDITKPEKDYDSLLRTAIILIVLNFLGKLLKNFVGQFQDVLHYAEKKVVIQSVADKSWKLDYKMLGDPDLNRRIASMNRWLYSHGILNIPGNLKSLISSLVSVGLSFSILSQLFLSKAEGQEKIVGFLNGWGFAAVFILWFLVALIFSMFSKRKSAEISM
ncbi:MAG: hypothetical protein K6G60_08210, partial [Lachnospiraceae bacterium]|nr:hypothetical protein [Lachnospiraceae bacterium]